MKNTEKNKSISPFHIEVNGISIKVFKVGASPRIPSRSNDPNDPEVMRGVHTHFTYEVFFITSDRLKLVTEEYSKFYERSILIISPKIKHYSVPGNDECYCLLFSFEASNRSAEKTVSAIKERLADGVCELPLSDELAFYIKTLSAKSVMATEEAERDASLLTELIFNGIMRKLAPRDRNEAHKSMGNYEHIGAIEAFINQNIHEKITLSDVAKSVYLSTKQIARIIEREYGCGFTELITEKRLASAEMLIKNTDMKISEIAERTFYGTEAYFYTMFKKRYGMSPLQYRKEAKLFND